jgi:hypothetical protein
MATQDPTDDGRAVSLSIPARNKAFLRCTIAATRDGIRDDLEHRDDELRQPRRKLLLEDAAYTSLLVALELGRVVPDDELRAALMQIAEGVERENEYERARFEHDAIHDLLSQLGGAVAE